MATKSAGRTLQALTRRARPTCECARATSSRAPMIRQFSASSSSSDVQYENDKPQRPRWSQTPEQMKAPYRWRIKNPAAEWKCNDDPAVLDNFYNNFLGRGGDQMLTEEVKWLAITHKSFDQGRRGFNDRLAFLGRRILNLQTNLALLVSPTAKKTQSLPNPSDDRTPFTHPALEGLANLSDVPLGEVLSKTRLAGLAQSIGMQEIIRWTPKDIHHLNASGLELILAHTMYAVIGAIALQKGGEVAARVAREKILKPLGIS
ncbi:Ribonuclease-III-like domain containing protein [Hyaloscypha variabilis]